MLFIFVLTSVLSSLRLFSLFISSEDIKISRPFFFDIPTWEGYFDISIVFKKFIPVKEPDRNAELFDKNLPFIFHTGVAIGDCT